jgi:hypothetical protein
MINGSYSLAVGYQSQMVTWWREDYERVKETMDLWNHDLLDVSIMKDEDLLRKLDQTLICTRRALDHARVLMQNSNFIDAENSWK